MILNDSFTKFDQTPKNCLGVLTGDKLGEYYKNTLPYNFKGDLYSDPSNIEFLAGNPNALSILNDLFISELGIGDCINTINKTNRIITLYDDINQIK